MQFKSILRFSMLVTWVAVASTATVSAQSQQTQPKVVRVTGVRFAYPLIEQWIEAYGKLRPDVQIVIEWRGTTDPSQYDILVEAYEQGDEIQKNREYAYIARYAILPVATSTSEFSRAYSTKGLTKSNIRQVFFNDIFADNGREPRITLPFTPYTRLQKAGSPIVFANYFKYEQKDIAGKGIAGSDEHLLKAVLRDTAGVTFLPTPLIYVKETGLPVAGLTVLPVDLNGNDRVSDDEKFYGTRISAIETLSAKASKEINNLPIEYIHLSVDKSNPNVEALSFIRWIIDNGLNDLKQFGFLSPEPSRLQREKFNEFAARVLASKP